MLNNFTWRELLIRFALVFFCLSLWLNGLNFFAIHILTLAWVVDGGLLRFGRLIKEPLVQAIVVLCVALLLGLLWSDYPNGGRIKWIKYFILLTFIPFLSLLNKARLPWVIGALLIGYFGVLFVGVYQWAILGQQGIPVFKMSYLSFSAMLGVGVILAVYLAATVQTKLLKILFVILALALLFIQFNQNARGLILATLCTLSFLLILLYRVETKKIMAVLASLIIVIAVFVFNSTVLQERLLQVGHDVELLQQGNYSSSVGYRIAMWDVGIDGIAKKPWLGHGTGMPVSYFENTVLTYKNGAYKDLPAFHATSHYHNDWIEIGMHLGLLGISALFFLLWSWYRAFKQCQLSILGATVVCYIFLAGLTDSFIIYSRI
ncbi:MAG: O-antigen ligase family protein, partial [Nitrosomonas sp.]|nr:O-antigen ligase family protein [Nitrosomonas sp.]